MSIDPTTILAGRAPELHEIDLLLARAGEGVGGLVLVAGEAGIGKTALAEHTAVTARRAGFAVAWSACWQTMAVAPLFPWSRVISQLSDPDSDELDLVV